ncbi:ThuA domain-containing protein [Dyadobacter flavalbus]|uniref:ThuA domain-containing protein n=2 Tax=Dyadobacter flavalbus TaxID=2579942 RepID=A0A5M8QWI3_9BACT|nr:ThuA domain-containing protein [Dyadobacter flavalbus]
MLLSVQKLRIAWLFMMAVYLSSGTTSAQQKPLFRVIAFFTGKNDKAHISFVNEANRNFPKLAEKNHFTYDTTSNWNNLNAEFLSKYQVVLFLDTRPETSGQREAFRHYMEHGGAWMGFHFAAFALTPSAYPQNWDWYHNEFLGSGQYKSNTWRPTSAILKAENRNHPAVRGISATIKASPNEWYQWENDLTQNKDIQILLSIDPSSFPLGTGPKQHEIWKSGYYPVVWTNRKYRMIYLNMGHNDIDYENKTDKELSFTFDNDVQNQFIINALIWLGNK